MNFEWTSVISRLRLPVLSIIRYLLLLLFSNDLPNAAVSIGISIGMSIGISIGIPNAQASICVLGMLLKDDSDIV